MAEAEKRHRGRAGELERDRVVKNQITWIQTWAQLLITWSRESNNFCVSILSAIHGDNFGTSLMGLLRRLSKLMCYVFRTPPGTHYTNVYYYDDHYYSQSKMNEPSRIRIWKAGRGNKGSIQDSGTSRKQQNTHVFTKPMWSSKLLIRIALSLAAVPD